MTDTTDMTRKLTIPPEYAYGDEGVADIPPKSTLSELLLCDNLNVDQG